MTKTHWLQSNFRLESLSLIINGLENSISEIERKLKEIEWFDVLWYLEEIEPILGLSFIAFQNYINSCIYDRCESLLNKHEMYKVGNTYKKTGRTEIELIIGIANY